MSWIGEYAEITILDKQKEDWYIRYDESNFHVLYSYITDLRPVICELAKPIFNIPSLPCIWTVIHGKKYILYRLETYQKIDSDPSDEIKTQIQRLYTFQYLMRADSKQTFILHREKFVPTVYSIGYRFTGKITLSDFIRQKWFVNDNFTIQKMVCCLLSGKSSSQITLSEIELLEERLVSVVKQVDGQYIWYVSDIINEQIMYIF